MGSFRAGGGALGQEGGALGQQGAPPFYSSLWETLCSLYVRTCNRINTSALHKLLGKLGIYATWLSSIAYLQKQLRTFVFFYATFISVITHFLIA